MSGRAAWGDLEDEEIEDQQLDVTLPEDEVIGPDENGIKRVITYSINDDGKREKRVQTIRIENRKVRVHTRVIERRKLPKFGDSARDGEGINQATTTHGEDVYLDLVRDAKSLDDGTSKEQEKMKQHAKLTKFVQMKMNTNTWARRGLEGEDEASAPSEKGPSDKYIPPSRQGGRSYRDSGPSYMQDRQEATLRVSNLSEDTREHDLQTLFRPYGPIARIYLAKDKERGTSKGFAFIHYLRKESGDKAIEALHGHGYDHLILSVEWSKPMAPRKY